MGNTAIKRINSPLHPIHIIIIGYNVYNDYHRIHPISSYHVYIYIYINPNTSYHNPLISPLAPHKMLPVAA